MKDCCISNLDGLVNFFFDPVHVLLDILIGLNNSIRNFKAATVSIPISHTNLYFKN